MTDNQLAVRMAWVKPQFIVRPRAFLRVCVQLLQEAVEVGAASGPRNVEEEEQILEAHLVPILVAPRRGIRPAPDDPLAVPVPVVGADEWKQRH